MSAESPDINDPKIARARAMRVAGAETAEIKRACLAITSSRTRSEPGSTGNTLF